MCVRVLTVLSHKHSNTHCHHTITPPPPPLAPHRACLEDAGIEEPGDLLELRDEDLVEMGVRKIVERRKLKTAIECYRAQWRSAMQATSADAAPVIDPASGHGISMQ